MDEEGGKEGVRVLERCREREVWLED